MTVIMVFRCDDSGNRSMTKTSDSATNTVDLGKDPVRTCFTHFLLPSMAGMVIKSLYVIADTMFIGHALGETGLAAINIVIPYFAFMFAMGMMIGVGGSALMGIRFGEGKIAEGQAIFRQSLTLVTIVIAAMSAATLIWQHDIVQLFGAKDELIPLSQEYVATLTLFSTPYAIGWVLSNFVRPNDGNPNLVMKAMVFSALTNIVLDWVFMIVLKWGMFGGALATGIAQLSMTAILLWHFRSPACRLVLRFTRLSLTHVKAIFSNGMPTFIMESSVGVLILTSNWVLLKLGGNLYLSVYGVALNCMWLAVLLTYGVCQAAQPLVSFNHGANKPERILESLNIATGLVIILCVITGGLAIIFPGEIMAAFVSNPSTEMIELGKWVMVLYGMAVIPMALNIVVTGVYQAIARARISSAMSMARGFILPVAGLFVLPGLMSENAVWSNMLVAEALTVLVSLYLLISYRRTLLQQIQSKPQTPDEPLPEAA